MILSAALLFVGCTKELEQKVTDLTSRVDAVEQQIAANKAAIETLQAAVQSMTGDRVTNVTETAVGWTVTLSSGKTLVLYGGSTEAVFFKSVVKGEKEVTFTLADGTTIVLPFGEEEFALVLDTDDLVVYPGTTVEVAYEVKGANAGTVVDVMPSYPYGAEVKDGKIVITIPDIEEALPAAKIIAFADNGKGKSSIKVIIINGQIVETATVGAAAPFWAGTTTFNVPANVPVTAELANEKDAAWCTVSATKAITDHKFAADCKVTPYADTRTAKINILDPAGEIVQVVEIAQGGTGNSIYYVEGDKFVDTFDKAVAAIEAGTGDTGTIWVSATHGLVTNWSTLTIPANATKKYVIIPRPYGAETAEGPNQYRFRGAKVLGNVDVTLRGIGLMSSDPANKIEGGKQFNGYMYGLYISQNTHSNIVAENVQFYTYTSFANNEGTHLVVDLESKANVTVKGCEFDGQAHKDNMEVNTAVTKLARLGQIYGGTITVDGNVVKNGYSSYGFRVGGNAKATFTDNLVDTENFIDLHSSAVAGECSCTLGDGVTDNNHYSANVKLVVKAAQANCALAPESAIGAPGQDAGNVEWNGYKFAKIQSAINFAGKEPAEITVGAGEYDENVKIANGTNITLKAAEGAILNGNIEIAGKANINGLTIKTKEGVTNNVLTCSVTGDGYAWGHVYLARVENGASDVTFENCVFDATLKNDDFNGTMSMLWISQATNVKVLDCTFTSIDGGAYAPNQTHQADVIWSGCKFIGDTHKHWAIRAMDTDVMTVTKCEFDSDIAIDVYNNGTDNFKGTLILGDGVVDDNIYGANVTKAVCGDKAVSVAAGATFLPADMSFNEPRTDGKTAVYLEKVFEKRMKDLFETENDNCDIRQITLGTDYIYAPQATKPGVVYMIDPSDGSIKKQYEIADNGGHWAIGAAATLEDGTVILSNMAGVNDTQKLCIYKATATGAELLYEFQMALKDGLLPRLGDMMTAYGTMEDGKIIFLDYAIKAAQKYRIYEFFITNGTVSGPYIQYVPGTDVEPYNLIGCAIGTATRIAGTTQYFICPDSTQGLNGYPVINRWGSGTDFGYASIMNLEGWMYGVIPAPENGGQYRDPEFFKLGDKFYCAVLDMKMDGGTNSKGAVLKVFEHNDTYQPGDWKESTLVASAELSGGNANRNSCASLGVQVKDGVATIAYVLRDNSLGAYQLHF